MPLLYVLDEDVRGPLWRHILRYNARGIDPIDVIRVGDFDDLPLGILDPDILLWCEASNRVLISHDRSTTPSHLKNHLAAGHHCPGDDACHRCKTGGCCGISLSRRARERGL